MPNNFIYDKNMQAFLEQWISDNCQKEYELPTPSGSVIKCRKKTKTN